MTRGPIHLPIHDRSLREALRRGARATAWVAGTFLTIVAVAMLAIVVHERTESLTSQTRTDELKRQLAAAPSDAMRTAIRDEDLRLRDAYFHGRALLVHGAWLLLGGAAVLVVSVKLSWELSASPYLPTGAAPDEASRRGRVRGSVATAAVVFAAVLLILAFPNRRSVSVAPALAPSAVGPSTVPEVTVVKPARLPADAWPAFRGAGGIGIAVGEYPTQWDAPAGKGILWKSRVPLAGNSSPAVCGGKVFVTGGSNERRELYSFDAASGALQWTRQVGPAGGPEPKLAADTGWAPSTPAVDGARVFAIFPTGELACFDLPGQLQWEKHLGIPDNIYGHASSLLCAEGLLYVQFDQGSNAKEGKSALLALDGATGRQVWKADRPVGASWSSPVLVRGPAGTQVVTMGDPWVIGYDAKAGTELWRARGLSGEVATSAAFANGFVYAATEQSRLFQIRVDGRGDVTATHVKKIDSDALPDIVSPLALGDRVLLVQTSGTAAWVNPAAAKDVWTHDFEGGVHASPVAVGKLVYLVGGEGVTFVFEAADAFQQLSASPLGQPVMATPAFSAGRIYIRGQTDLFCVGTK